MNYNCKITYKNGKSRYMSVDLDGSALDAAYAAKKRSRGSVREVSAHAYCVGDATITENGYSYSDSSSAAECRNG